VEQINQEYLLKEQLLVKLIMENSTGELDQVLA
jgi:hypothetical protein